MSTTTKLGFQLLLFILVALAACTTDSESSSIEQVEPDAEVALVWVNEEPIYRSEVLRRIHAAYGDDIEEMMTTDPNRWQMLLDTATESAIVDELLLQAARAEDMQVSTEEAQKLLDQSKGVAGEQIFSEMLDERGASQEEFQSFLVEQALIKQYKEQLFDKLDVDEGTLRKHYEGHVETYAEPDKVRLEVFTLGVRATADKVYELWSGGESFDSIAKAYYDEAEQVGRRTRWMPISAVPAELQMKVTVAKTGIILEPARILDRFYVVKVVEKKKAHVKEFADVKEEIRQKILKLRKEKTLDEWYKATSRKAKMEYLHSSQPNT
jgi:parvulin-like peptidyl-prolyl isomerase